jgi:SAM-dependent methyltransferase
MDSEARTYYRQRAPEYDDWWNGTGLFEQRDRPGWQEDVAALCAALEALPPARTLDVGCGTGFLTAHLPGDVIGLDQSEEMLAIARDRLPEAQLVAGDGVHPPFADGSFDRIHAGHFYGHLDERQRLEFLGSAGRLAGELVITDSALRDGGVPERHDERVLNDGSRHQVYKRWFTPEGLIDELGGGEVVFAGEWFVSVRFSR